MGVGVGCLWGGGGCRGGIGAVGVGVGADLLCSSSISCCFSCVRRSVSRRWRAFISLISVFSRLLSSSVVTNLKRKFYHTGDLSIPDIANTTRPQIATWRASGQSLLHCCSAFITIIITITITITFILILIITSPSP